MYDDIDTNNAKMCFVELAFAKQCYQAQTNVCREIGQLFQNVNKR